jgi:hypothetical protein
VIKNVLGRVIGRTILIYRILHGIFPTAAARGCVRHPALLLDVFKVNVVDEGCQVGFGFACHEGWCGLWDVIQTYLGGKNLLTFAQRPTAFLTPSQLK